MASCPLNIAYLEIAGQMPIFRLYRASTKEPEKQYIQKSFPCSGNPDGLQYPSHRLLKSKPADNAGEHLQPRLGRERMKSRICGHKKKKKKRFAIK